MTPVADGQAPKPEGPTKLSLLFEEAIRCLDGTDLPGANAALKRAYAEAAKPMGYAGAAPGARKMRNGSEDWG